MNGASTTEKPISKTREEIIKEALRIEEATLFSSKGNFKSAEIWRGMHLGLGLSIVVLAAVTASKAFSRLDADGTIAGFLAIFVAVLSAMNTFLNPNKKAAEHLSAGNKYDALMNKVRIFRTIDCWGDSSDNTLAGKLKTHSDDKSALNKAGPPISALAYWLAKRGIQQGEGQYSIDGKPGADAQPGKPPALPTDKP